VIGPASPAAWRYVDRLAADAIARHHPICFDSAAMIALITRTEPVASLVRRLLRDIDVPIVISTITLAEIVVRPARQGDLTRVRNIHSSLAALANVAVIDLDPAHAIETAIVRGLTSLRLPDAAIVATARLANASALIGNDRQWRHKPLSLAKSDGLPSLLSQVVEAMTPDLQRPSGMAAGPLLCRS